MLEYLGADASVSREYVLPDVVELTGPLDASALVEALRALVSRQRSLRTRFVTEGGEFFQEVVDERLEVPVLTADTIESAELFAHAATQASFATTGQTYFRSTLIDHPSGWLLVVVTHHLVSDLWSRGVMFRELSELYNAVLEGRPPLLTPLRRTPIEIARGDAARFSPRRRAETTAFWGSYLSGYPTTRAFDDSTTHVAVPAHLVPLDLGPELTARVHASARRRRVTPFTLLVAARLIQLRSEDPASDALVGTNVSTRLGPELENLVGYFTNTLFFRIRLGDATFDEVIAGVWDDLARSAPHRNLHWVSWLNALGLRDVFLHRVALQDTPHDHRLHLRAVDAKLRATTPTHTRRLSELSLQHAGDRLAGWLATSSTASSVESTARSADEFVTVLSRLIA